MRLDLENLPTDQALLHHLVRDMAGRLAQRDDEVERLRLIIRKLQRTQFGARSEKLSADQLALGLEDLDTDLGAAVARAPESAPTEPLIEAPPRRKPLPDHLPRQDKRVDIDTTVCECCGGELHAIGESVSEMLDWVPAQVRVLKITRPKYGCRKCHTAHQAPAPPRAIAGGLATPALLAQVLIAKYCDHTPLYRQSQIFARHGVELERSTLAGWVGGACWWLDTLHEALCANVFASEHLFADDTPVPVLDPGRGRTKTGRLWVYARDDRRWAGPAPPAAVYIFAPDRRAERPVAHLQHFKGVLQVDGYAGFEQLTRRGQVTLAACWAHCPESRFIWGVWSVTAEILGQRVSTTRDNNSRRIRWRRGRPGDPAWVTMDAHEPEKDQSAPRSARGHRASFAGWWLRSGWSSRCWHGRGNRGSR
jgi:transposase